MCTSYLSLPNLPTLLLACVALRVLFLSCVPFLLLLLSLGVYSRGYLACTIACVFLLLLSGGRSGTSSERPLLSCFPGGTFRFLLPGAGGFGCAILMFLFLTPRTFPPVCCSIIVPPHVVGEKNTCDNDIFPNKMSLLPEDSPVTVVSRIHALDMTSLMQKAVLIFVTLRFCNFLC